MECCYIQFGSVQKNYNDYYDYNSVENLYSLKYIIEYIKYDSTFKNKLIETLPYNRTSESASHIDIANCDIDIIEGEELKEYIHQYVAENLAKY